MAPQRRRYSLSSILHPPFSFFAACAGCENLYARVHFSVSPPRLVFAAGLVREERLTTQPPQAGCALPHTCAVSRRKRYEPDPELEKGEWCDEETAVAPQKRGAGAGGDARDPRLAGTVG